MYLFDKKSSVVKNVLDRSTPLHDTSRHEHVKDLFRLTERLQKPSKHCPPRANQIVNANNSGPKFWSSVVLNPSNGREPGGPGVNLPNKHFDRFVETNSTPRDGGVRKDKSLKAIKTQR